MKSSKVGLCIALFVVALAGQAKASLVDFDLLLTNLDSNSATFDVVIDYTPDVTNSGLVFLTLDVGGSSDNLTNTLTDYSRFSFTRSAVLNGWDIVGLDTDFSEFNSLLSYETRVSGTPLFAGQHTIGQITVDLIGLGGESVLVDLTRPDSFFFGTDAGEETPPIDFDTFELISEVGTLTVDSERFDVPQGQGSNAIPEPATAALGLMGLSLLAIRRRRAA